MARSQSSRKRKDPAAAAQGSDGDGIDGAMLEGILSQSEDGTDAESGSSSDGEDGKGGSDWDAHSASSDDELQHSGDDDDKGADAGWPATSGPRFRVVTDANGGERYEYQEIDPVYDSDDSDAQKPANTIGDIPLSFYDSYPHIGYDINGKKIMRPATGEALDALLDSIELPKGWTGLTDPQTGKPLNLTRDELELLRRLQTGEVPEDGYDPYPVSSHGNPCLINVLADRHAGDGSLLHQRRRENAAECGAGAKAPICSIQTRGQASSAARARHQGWAYPTLQASRDGRQGRTASRDLLRHLGQPRT